MTQQEFRKRYEFDLKTDTIGGGSFGTVYKAYDTVLDIEVAIKVSEVKTVGDKEFSLLEEYKAIENLTEHKNIANYEKVYRFESFPAIYDYGIMQYYELGNLSHYLKNNEVSLAKRQSITKDILVGIAFLHQHKVVHRDLKPSNILVVDRRGKIIPKITDFGLSKQAEGDGKASRFTNSFAGGTLQYSSPEQLKGLPLKLNTDLWSFGAIAYEILTGKTLFEADSQGTASAEWQNTITQKILHADVSKELEKLPVKWKKVVTACLEKDVNKRIQNASTLFSILNDEVSFDKDKLEANNDTTIIKSKNQIKKDTVKPDEQATSNHDEATRVKGKESQEKVLKKPIKPIKSPKKPKNRSKLRVAVFSLIFIIVAYFLWLRINLEKKSWEKAKQQNNIEAFNTYLKDFPESKYIDEANAFIEILKEEKKLKVIKQADSIAWQKAVNKNTVNGYLEFKKRSSTSIYINKVDTILKTLSWDKTYGGKNRDYAHSIIETNDGGYIVAGNTVVIGPEDGDFKVLKINNKGQIDWEKKIGGRHDDQAKSIIHTADGSYIVAGYTWSKGAGAKNIWLIKINVNGKILWDKTFGGKSFDDFGSIFQTFDKGFLIAGTTESKGSGGKDFWIIKVNSVGEVIWDKTFGGLRFDEANSIIQTNEGGYLVIGQTYSKGSGSSDAWFVKIDSKGEKQWDKTLGGAKYDNLNSIIQTLDGGYIAVGITYSKGKGEGDFWIVKVNNKGGEQWDKTFGGKGEDSAESIIQSADGGYMIVGTTVSKGEGRPDFWLVKINNNGLKQWDKTFGGKSYDIAKSVIQTSDEGYMVAGYTGSKGAGDSDIWLIKIDKEGSLQ